MSERAPGGVDHPTQAPALARAATRSSADTARHRASLNPRRDRHRKHFLAITGLAIWYLVRAEPLLAQGIAESTCIDIAARVSGRLEKIATARGQNICAGANPARHR